jgi:hypothetical protein
MGDFKPYAFETDDYGKTWTAINAGLPDYDCLYVIREGVMNPNLLYLGSEMSLRVSLDKGKTWSRFRSNNWPTVAVHDLQVHPRDLDLIIGTHGMGVWTMDVSGLERLNDSVMATDVSVLKPQNVLLLGRVDFPNWEGERNYMSPNTQPGTKIFYYLKSDVTGDVSVKIGDVAGVRFQQYPGSNKAGLNAVHWDGQINGRAVAPGEYKVTVTAGGKDYMTSVTVEAVYTNGQPAGNAAAAKKTGGH